MKRDETKQFIDENIVENSGGAISAYKLNQVLTKMVDNTAGVDEISPNETCLIHLTASGISDWSSQVVVVNNQSTGEQESVSLNADGTAEIVVPNGQSYQVLLPYITGYIQPEAFNFVAVTAQRELNYEYTSETRMEKILVTTLNGLNYQQQPILDGETLTVTCTDGSTYSGEFDGATCAIEIPYGKTYTVPIPDVEGYRKISSPETFLADRPLRTLNIYHTEESYGLFGVDDNGTLYTPDECALLPDKTIIKYGFYNDSDLAASTRVNDGVGNGFFWEIAHENIGSFMWCDSNVEFDVQRLPFYSNLGTWKYAGAYMTQKIIEIGLELNKTTPAATACNNKTITINGQVHQGILLAYDQIHKIATDNRTLFQALYTALGRTAPTIWSGIWWTSCQSNASNAVGLDNGGFRNYYKTDSYNVFCAYDL